MIELSKVVLPLILGSLLTLVGVFFTSWLERQTAASSFLYESRLRALSEVWKHLAHVKWIFGKKISLGHTRFLREHSEEAQDAVDAFRRSLEESQVVLDGEVVGKLRDIDTYLAVLLAEDDQRPSDYIKELSPLIKELEAAVQKSMRKKTQTITLEFR